MKEFLYKAGGFIISWILISIICVAGSLFITVGIDYLADLKVDWWAVHRVIAFIVFCLASGIYFFDSIEIETEEDTDEQ